MAKTLTITKQELAELLGLKVSWVEDKCRAREIPHLKIAGAYRFTEQHVAAIIAMHERPVAETPPAIAAAPAPQRRARAPRPLPTIPTGVAPPPDRGLPLHRLRRATS